ncbi:MAG: DUF983 domain-containing protein [Beijerinckiaceae bacterium]
MPSGNSCPRCGNGKLFDGFLGLKPSCQSCGLSYDFADAGDGPAVFVILGAGAVMAALVLWTEVTYEPPLWLHAVVFLPLTLIVCLAMLRPLKASLIHRQYVMRAEQGRVQR